MSLVNTDDQMRMESDSEGKLLQKANEVDQDSAYKSGIEASTSIHVKGDIENMNAVDDQEFIGAITDELTETHCLCIEKILKESSNGFEGIGRKYGAILKNQNKEYLTQEITHVLRNVKAMVKEEFPDFLEQEQIPFSVAELEQVIGKFPQDSKEGQTWRPSGHPEEDIKPHIQQQKLNYIQLLDERLKSEEEDLNSLKMEVIAKRRKFKETLDKLNQIAKVLDKDSESAKNFIDKHADDLSCSCVEMKY